MYSPDFPPTAQEQKFDVTDAFIGSDFLVFVGYDNDPNNAVPIAPVVGPAAGAANPQAGGELRHKTAEIAAFGRYVTPRGGEGTRLDYPYKVEDASGITDDWQAFEGGLCYRTQDNKLHLLMGRK